MRNSAVCEEVGAGAHDVTRHARDGPDTAPPALEQGRARQESLAHLIALGAADVAHVGGSLADHLRRTHDLLESFGARRALCIGGLYHAVYGTAGISATLVDAAQRAGIERTIGAEAESIAYMYGACDRARFHPRIGTSDERHFADRFLEREYLIGEAALRDFCELTVANQLDLARHSAKFRSRYSAQLREFCGRLDVHLSRAARGAWRQAFSGPPAAGS